jgi:3-hydroxyisobutyrate dehydrogenase-like beta-hydroxyacid dehydrogenase
VKVAFLGTGKMASAMARRVAAGHEVVLWNRTQAKAESLGLGKVAPTPADAVGAADVVLLALTGPDAAVSVLEQTLSTCTGRVFVDMTTAGARVFRTMTPRLKELDATLIIAPIFGSVPAVEAGTLVVMVGEDVDEAAVARARPVLESFGKLTRVRRTEDAIALKLLRNAMFFLSGLAAAELLSAGSRAGTTPEATFAEMAALVPHLEARRAGYVNRVHEPVTFRLADAVKDLDLALEHFRGTGASMPVTALTRELYAELIDAAGEAELTAVIERYGHR